MFLFTKRILNITSWKYTVIMYMLQNTTKHILTKCLQDIFKGHSLKYLEILNFNLRKLMGDVTGHLKKKMF